MTVKHSFRIQIFIYCIAFAFVLLIARLYYLQIIRGTSFLERSESNFIQERVIKHSRGKILDAEGRVLVDNRLAYDLFVTFSMLPDSLVSLKAITAPFKMQRKDLLLLNKEILLRASHNVDDDILIAEGKSRQICDEIFEIARVKMISGVKFTFTQGSKGETCQVFVNSMEFPSQMQAFNRLSRLLSIKNETLGELWDKAKSKASGIGGFKPSLLCQDIGFDAYAQVENAISLGRLAGVSVVPSKRRRYIYDNFASHAIGYLNQVSVNDIKNQDGVYRSGDFIGRDGVEQSFESYLRGADGTERVIVDAKGRRFHKAWEEGLLGEDRITPPVPGSSLRLSINHDLQDLVQEYFTTRSGSVVVTDVNTGFILAFASFPDFNPNVIVKADNAVELKALLADPDRVFRNKAVQDHYPPGSTFKPFTAVSGLNNKLITADSIHYCSGTFRVHKTHWRCFKREGHGPINMFDALKVSCSSYYYDLGYRLGIEKLATTARTLGFGQKTGIALSGETKGTLPDKEYYKKRLGYNAPGFVVNMAVGQGDLDVSPLQLVMAYSALANGGTLYHPQLVHEVIDSEGNVVKEFKKKVVSKISDAQVDFALVRRGMSNVTNERGTAHSIHYKPELVDLAKWLKQVKLEGISVAGKTGTAQVVKLSKAVDHLNVEDVPYEQRDHSWFAGFFPAESPEIAVVVMTEHGGGGSASAPMAVRIMKKWHEMHHLVTAQAPKGVKND